MKIKTSVFGVKVEGSIDTEPLTQPYVIALVILLGGTAIGVTYLITKRST